MLETNNCLVRKFVNARVNGNFYVHVFSFNSNLKPLLLFDTSKTTNVAIKLKKKIIILIKKP